jgi:hypothetical protein
MSKSEVRAIYTSPDKGLPMESQQNVVVEAGRGFVAIDMLMGKVHIQKLNHQEYGKCH